MASTIHTLINYNIEFTPASASQKAVQDGSLKYILLKPENEPAKKQNTVDNVRSKKSIAKFGVHKFQHEQSNCEVKQSTGNRKSLKKKTRTIENRQQKKQRQMDKS
uniref:Ovule protein n=1 Tax=Elaeophora elaphi TaxID=1147741 RepID=A0A0R3RZP4_9BILA